MINLHKEYKYKDKELRAVNAWVAWKIIKSEMGKSNVC